MIKFIRVLFRIIALTVNFAFLWIVWEDSILPFSYQGIIFKVMLSYLLFAINYISGRITNLDKTASDLQTFVSGDITYRIAMMKKSIIDTLAKNKDIVGTAFDDLKSSMLTKQEEEYMELIDKRREFDRRLSYMGKKTKEKK